MLIGILALQGDFSLHSKVLNKLDVNSILVRKEKDFDNIDALIIPGGESTTLSLLIDKFKLRIPLMEFGKSFPVLGTCAGLIIMAKRNNDNRVNPLELLDVVVERNAYGRQIQSSQKKIWFKFNNEKTLELLSTFIRAPKIKSSGKNVQILGKFQGKPIAVLSGHLLGLTFHPEIDQVDVFHRMMFDKSSQFYYEKLKQNYAA